MELATRRRRREIGSGSAFERKEDRETGIEGGEREGRGRGEGGEREGEGGEMEERGRRDGGEIAERGRTDGGETERAYKYEEEGTLACKVGVIGSKTGS